MKKNRNSIYRQQAICFIVFFLIVYNCHLYGQTKVSSKQILVSMEDAGNLINSFVKENKLQVVRLVYQNYIDPEDKITINEGKLRERITALYPNPQQTGKCILDWEGKAMKALEYAPLNSTQFLKAYQCFLKALSFAKQLRPNIEWGVYNLPFSYNEKNVYDVKRERKMMKLYSKLDILTPSLYEHYKPNFAPPDMEDHIRKNLNKYLSLKAVTGKPLYPFLWHRWNAGKNIRYQLIPKHDFDGYIKNILYQTKSGYKADGVVWWSQETYFFRTKQPEVFTGNLSLKKFAENSDALVTDYLNEILAK